MLDPISIGLAFTAAQSAVKGIKSALQLGKDINEVGGELSKFFLSSATVYSAQSAARMKNSNKTDAELGAQALQTVMQAKKLRDQEKELKEQPYSEVFNVIVECKNEAEQEKIFNRLDTEGYKCRVQSL